MPRVSDEWIEGRRALILEAALAVFAEAGYEGASTARIAERAGVSEGLIYRYFPGKRALLVAGLAGFRDAMFAQLEARVFSRERFIDRLEMLVGDYLRGLIENPGVSRLFLAETRRAASLGEETGRLLTGPSRNLWRRLVTQAIEAGEVGPSLDKPLTRAVIWAGIEAAADRLLAVPGGSVEKTARELTRLLAHGVVGASLALDAATDTG